MTTPLLLGFVLALLALSVGLQLLSLLRRPRQDLSHLQIQLVTLEQVQAKTESTLREELASSCQSTRLSSRELREVLNVQFKELN